MRRWLAILAVALGVTALATSPAAAACRTQTFFLADGSVQTCTTCCTAPGVCTTTCT